MKPLMNLEEFIEQLEKTQRAVGGLAEVYLHYEGEEIEVFGISVRLVGDGEYQVIIE